MSTDKVMEQEQQQKQFSQMQGQAAPDTQEQTLKKPEAGKGKKARYCKYCEKPLANDVVFCVNCREKHGGEENVCPYCGQATTKKSCPKCPNVTLVPNTCPKCGAKTINPVCACGEVLDKKMKTVQATQAEVQSEPVSESKRMNAEEVKKIEAIIKAEEESKEFKKFRKNLLERQKLLEEREYYNNMQREIIEVFGERPFKIEIPNPEEQAAQMRLYASLEQSIKNKQRRATQEELEALYPELRHIHEAENKAAEEKEAAEEEARKRRLEQAKRQKALEEKFNAILEEVDNEIDEAKKAEEKKRILAQKAAEEERLRREKEEVERREREENERRAQAAEKVRIAAEERAREEAERLAREQKTAAIQREKERKEAQQKAERLAYQNRFLGTYYYEGSGITLTIVIENDKSAYCRDKYKELSYTICSAHKLTINGSKLTLQEESNQSDRAMSKLFKGDINDGGTLITGNWYRKDGGQNCFLTYFKID